MTSRQPAHMSAFGPLLDALQIADGTLQLAKDDYQWLSDTAFFDLSYAPSIPHADCGDIAQRPAA